MHDEARTLYSAASVVLMQERLVAGLNTMHDDSCRRNFLLDAGRNLEGISRWLCDAGLDEQVNASYAPTFLHGGSSAGKWVIMGINPGADDQPHEHTFKRASPENYLHFHEQFFLHFPRLRRNERQPWWSKLYRVTRVLEGIVAEAGAVPWSELDRCSTFVVQDLLPFHGRTNGTLKSLESGALGTIANATIEGVSRSAARGVLVFSPDGYKLFDRHPRVHITRRFELAGQSSKGSPRRIRGYVARIAKIPLVALNNQFISQPWFPYNAALPLLLAELRREGLVES